jgi:glycine cleavage system aminomethyltransferase T
VHLPNLVLYDRFLKRFAVPRRSPGSPGRCTLESLGVGDLQKLNFMCARPATIAGIDTFITRCGYTGEDGFEISAPHDKIVQLAKKARTRG